jgi:hypothetical protein
MVRRISLLIALGAGAVATAVALVDCLQNDPNTQEQQAGQPMVRPPPDPLNPTTPPPVPTLPVPAPRPTVPRPGPTDTGDPGPPGLTR